MPKRSPLLLLLLLGAGCSQALLYGKDNMPLAQAKGAMAKEGGMGHVDAQLQPLPGQESSKSARDTFALEMTSSEGGRICVKTQTQGVYSDDMKGNDAQQLAANHDKILGWWQQMEMVFEARQSFDDWTEDTAWPGDAKQNTEDATIKELRHRYVEHLDTSTGPPGYRVDYEINWCGRVQGLDASSRFITVTRLPKVSQSFGPVLFVWAIDGANEVVVAPVAPPPMAVPGGEGLVAALTKMGNFTILLRAVAKAGIAGELDQSSGYTLFALTDKAFAKATEKEIEDLVGDATASSKFIRNLTLGSAVDFKTFSSSDAGFKTLGTQRVRAKVRGGVVYIGDQRIVQPDVMVGHGILHVTD